MGGVHLSQALREVILSFLGGVHLSLALLEQSFYVAIQADRRPAAGCLSCLALAGLALGCLALDRRPAARRSCLGGLALHWRPIESDALGSGRVSDSKTEIFMEICTDDVDIFTEITERCTQLAEQPG